MAGLFLQPEPGALCSLPSTSCCQACSRLAPKCSARRAQAGTTEQVDRNHKTKQFSNQHLGYFNRGQHLHIKLNHQFQPEQMYFCLNGAEWSMGFEASFWRRWHRGKTPAKLCSAGSQPQQSALNTHVFPVYSHKADEHKQKQHKGPPLMRVCLFLIASCLTLLSLTLGRLTQ